MKKVTKKY